MKKYVFTIKDDVCIANGKDIEATELLAKMRLWGDVEDYDRAISAVKAEYQSTVDNLTTQLQAIKEQELTDDEILFLNFYRERKVANAEVYQRKIALLENGIEEMRVASLKRAEQIALLAEQLKEMGA